MKTGGKLTSQNIFIGKYFVISFFEGVNFLLPYLAIMFNDYGLNAKQIAFVFAVTKFSQLILEIPSGALADRFGRKKTLLLGNVSFIVNFIILLFVKDFNAFILSAIFSGLSFSLVSGTYMALIYDNMRNLDIDKQFGKLRGRAWSLRFVGTSLSALVAAYLIRFGYNYVILASVFATLCSFLLILSLKDSYGKNTENIVKLNKDYWKIVKGGMKYIFKHTSVLKFILFWALFTSILNTLSSFKEFFLFEITSKKELVGILVAIQMIIEAIARWILSSNFLNKKTQKMLFVIFVASFLTVAGFMYYSFPISYLLIVLYRPLGGSGLTITYSRIQKYLPSRWRSTIISIQDCFRNIMAILYLALFGFLSDKFTYKNGFIIVSSYQFILAGIFLFVLGWDRHLRKKEKELK